jgi:hypothetical protein
MCWSITVLLWDLGMLWHYVSSVGGLFYLIKRRQVYWVPWCLAVGAVGFYTVSIRYTHGLYGIHSVIRIIGSCEYTPQHIPSHVTGDRRDGKLAEPHASAAKLCLPSFCNIT